MFKWISLLFLFSVESSYASDIGFEKPSGVSMPRVVSATTVEDVPVKQKKKKRSRDGIDVSLIIQEPRSRSPVEAPKAPAKKIVIKTLKKKPKMTIENANLQQRQDLIAGALVVNNEHIYHYLGSRFLQRKAVDEFDIKSGASLIRLAATMHMKNARYALNKSLEVGYRTKAQYEDARAWMEAVEAHPDPETFYAMAKLFAEFPWVFPNNAYQTEQLYLKAYHLSK